MDARRDMVRPQTGTPQPDAQTSREASPLARVFRDELDQPVSDTARTLGLALRERFGHATEAILFYGSCLRKKTNEGVLDFYVLVDDYSKAYPGFGMALLNRILPPNVFFLQIPDPAAPTERLRAKVAVLSVADFERAVRPEWAEARVWARFTQPSRLVFCRGPETRKRVEGALTQAARTFVGHASAWLAEDDGVAHFDSHRFWTRAFSETYGAEFRTEKPETITALVAVDPERYERALDAVLAEGPLPGQQSLRAVGREYEVGFPPETVHSARRQWSRRRRKGKVVAALGLLKCVLTFDDWANYGIWKLERHRGAPIEISDRQRRHPLLLGWPVLWRLLRERSLR